MLRLIWSHPEFPTKEDIRDELRRSELRDGLTVLRGRQFEGCGLRATIVQNRFTV